MLSKYSKFRPISTGKNKLLSVIQAAGDVIHIEDAAAALSINRASAAKTLARWTNQGWLRRIESGAYVPAALDSLDSEFVLEDPWVLVPALFSPAYIGGRTAAEHWDLTEQIFRDVVVLTAQTVRKKQLIRHGLTFTLYHIQENKLFGTAPVWRSKSKILISDIHKTIIDMIDNPAIGGGIQHVYDCLLIYLKRADRDNEKLIDYAKRINNGAIFKRLGFLLEKNNDNSNLIDFCRQHLTTGYAKLDVSFTCSRLISRWNLWITPEWDIGEKYD